MWQRQGLMSQQEAQRLAVLRRVGQGDLLQAQAAAQLGVSVRQVKRLCRALRQCGPAGLISKRRGLPSNRRIAQSTQQSVLALVRKHYADFGPELAREYLARDHAFTHSTETLRGWMTQAGLWQPKPRRTKRVHPPRERRECLGGSTLRGPGDHRRLPGAAATSHPGPRRAPGAVQRPPRHLHQARRRGPQAHTVRARAAATED